MRSIKVHTPALVVVVTMVAPLMATAGSFTFRPFNQNEYVPPPLNSMGYPGQPQPYEINPNNNRPHSWPSAGPVNQYKNGMPAGPELNTPYPSNPSHYSAPNKSGQSYPRRPSRTREIQYQGYRFRADGDPRYQAPPMPPVVNQAFRQSSPSVVPPADSDNIYGYGYPNSDFRPMDSRGNTGVPQQPSSHNSMTMQPWQDQGYQNNSMNQPNYGSDNSANYNYQQNEPRQNQPWSDYPKYRTEEIKPGW